MPATDSPAVLVARFLKANHYHETLEAFLAEAGLPASAGDTKPGDWTVEKVLEEKKAFDASLAYEKIGSEEISGWPSPAPAAANEPDASVSSNILCISGSPNGRSILITAADRSWSQLKANKPYELEKVVDNDHGSPVLSMAFQGRFVFSTSMSGQLMIHDLESGRLIDKCRHHLKYAVQVIATHTFHGGLIVATAGWDSKVHIYSPSWGQLEGYLLYGAPPGDGPCLEGILGEPIHTISLPTNPESMVLVREPDTNQTHLVVSRRDSTFLYYYLIAAPDLSNESTRSNKYTVTEAGRQNLAPHSNAWVAFSPSSLALCPTDPTMLAVATSHTPHMKIIIVRLLFPASDVSSGNFESQASQARAALAVQDREDAAITLHVSTMAPQTVYSTPCVVWRPGGAGVWVNADDGVVRGVDTKSGKVVSLLKGHETGSKVRTLWAGCLGKDEGQEEVVISGGFDKRVYVWVCEEGQS